MTGVGSVGGEYHKELDGQDHGPMDETRIGNRYTYSGGALDYTRMLQEHPKNSTKDAHDRTASPSACAGQSKHRPQLQPMPIFCFPSDLWSAGARLA
jgi:hypothetical protein